MADNLKQIEERAVSEISGTRSLDELLKVEKQYLGRKGLLTRVLRSLGGLSTEEKRRLGPLANRLKVRLQATVELKKKSLASAEIPEFDLSEPGNKTYIGHEHVLTALRREVEDYFLMHGFSVEEGPEVESDFYNFEALNIPADHPARDMWDTFFVQAKSKTKGAKQQSGNLVLRTHTSPMQIRVMEMQKPPLAVIVPGRVFRHEATDARHEHTFDQVEGFLVDQKVSAAHLKYMVHGLFRHLFGEKVKIELRPSYFPFTEPSFELFMSCPQCNQKGCQICGTGWLEMLGCGMIHPKVFEAVGYPKGKYQGFAFGMGLSRVALLRYGIPDNRMFYANDLRVLRQF